MKKFLLIFGVLFFLTVSVNSQSLFSAYGGYSWLNGIVGVEYNSGGFGISGGFFPAKLPSSGDITPSWSASLSYYGKPYDETGWYGSIGVASAEPMTIIMGGIRGASGWHVANFEKQIFNLKINLI